MKSGAVKESAEVVRVEPIAGPGMCGAEYPLKVAALGEASSMYGFADDDLRPPAPIGNQPRWPIQQPPSSYPQNTRAIVVSAAIELPAQLSGDGGAPAQLRCTIGSDLADGTGGRRTRGRRDQPALGRRAVARRNHARALSRATGLSREGYPQSPSPQRDSAPYSPRTDMPPGTPQRLGPGPAQGNPVSSFGSVTLKPTATLACPIVSVLDRWISNSVQPSAQRWFGARVVEIKQISAYSCRGMNGNPNSHISEHAFGNALDIAAFTLSDGRRITVKDGWHGLPEEQGFLRDVQGAACQQFNTVLAPGSNQYHYDHIHVDLMRRASRRIICEPAAVSGEQIAARAGGRNPYASSREPYVTGSLGGHAHKHKSTTAKVNEEDEFEDD